MKLRLLFIYFILYSLVGFELSAQKKEKKKSRNYEKSVLFNSDEPIDLQVYVNRKELLNDVGDDRKYHPTIFRIIEKNNHKNDLELKLKTRGYFRRNPQNCNLPPLRVKIPKKVRKSDNILAGQYVLKLVLPCKRNNKKFQEYVIQEYLIYKIYGLLTDVSFRTRLVNIELIDSMKPEKSLNFTGFFIEEAKQLADRVNGKISKMERFHQKRVKREQMTRVAVFQYLIGNTDWSVDVGHNIKLLFINDQVEPYAVPFDFDWSGIINALYAFPFEQLNITSVRERVYRGYKREIEEFEPVIKLFNDKKEDIYSLYQNCEWLSEKTKSSTIKYIDDFYEVINNPKKLEWEFIKNCRK